MQKKIFIILLLCLMIIPLLSLTETKTYTILGDSWSTFKGYNTPTTNNAWYPTNDNTCEGYNSENNVIEVQQTWWYLLQRYKNLKLFGNYSFSGSPICNDGYGEGNNDARTYSFITRVKDINISPDIIFIQGGINDWAAEADIGEFQYENWTNESMKTFRPALAYLLDYLQSNTRADIIFLKSEIISKEIQESIDIICQHYNVPVLLLSNIELISWHPDKNGMEQICKIIEDYMEVKYANYE